MQFSKPKHDEHNIYFSLYPTDINRHFYNHSPLFSSVPHISHPLFSSILLVFFFDVQISTRSPLPQHTWTSIPNHHIPTVIPNPINAYARNATRCSTNLFSAPQFPTQKVILIFPGHNDCPAMCAITFGPFVSRVYPSHAPHLP